MPVNLLEADMPQDNNELPYTLLMCSKCRWFHAGITREEAQHQVDEANAFFDTLTPEEFQADYGSHRADIAKYLKCFQCAASYENLVPGDSSQCPDGVTIQAAVMPASALIQIKGSES